MSAGLGVLAYVLWGMNAIGGTSPILNVAGIALQAVWIGPLIMARSAASSVSSRCSTIRGKFRCPMAAIL